MGQKWIADNVKGDDIKLDDIERNENVTKTKRGNIKRDDVEWDCGQY